MTRNRPTLGFAVLALSLGALSLTTTARAQFAVEAIVLDGDAVDGVGNVTSIDAIAINDAGVWIVESDTDNADTDADSVLLKNGQLLFLREGDSLALPAGATIDGFDSIGLNSGNDSLWNLFLDGTKGIFDDSGIYAVDQLLIQEGDESNAPELSPGTPYIGFFETKINDGGFALLMASVDDPVIASSVDRALVRIVPGNPVVEQVFAKEGDILAGQVAAVTDFSTGPHGFDFNNAGDILFQADISGGATDAIYLNTTPLAIEGDPAPVAPRLWSSLNDPEMSLNNGGDYAFSGSMDGDTGSNLILVKNGDKLVQEADSPSDIAPFALTSFGSGPVLVNDAGGVLWYGDWDDSDTDVDTGLFLDTDLIVQEGVTAIDGDVVDTLRGVSEGYAMSDDGRYILFEAVLDDGRDGAFLITFDGVETADPTPGIAGQSNDFSASGAGDGAQVAILASTSLGAFDVPGCAGLKAGLSSPAIVGFGTADPDGNLTVSRVVPVGLAGQTVYIQAVDGTNCALGTLTTFTFG